LTWRPRFWTCSASIRTAQYKYIFTTGEHDLEMHYATGFGPPGITHRLYDEQRDPHEFHNLADSPQYSGVIMPPQLSLEEALVWFCEPPELPRE